MTSSKKPIEAPIIREFPPEDSPKLRELKKSELFPIEIHDETKNYLFYEERPWSHYNEYPEWKKTDLITDEDKIQLEKDMMGNDIWCRYMENHREIAENCDSYKVKILDKYGEHDVWEDEAYDAEDDFLNWDDFNIHYYLIDKIMNDFLKEDFIN